jgi:hypothetical protein
LVYRKSEKVVGTIATQRMRARRERERERERERSKDR